MNLNRNNCVRLGLCSLVILLSGCVTGNQIAAPNTDPLVITRPSAALPDKPHVVIKSVGEVLVGHSYTAASGRICRILSSPDGQLLAIRQCQSSTGKWYATRNIAASKPFE